MPCVFVVSKCEASKRKGYWSMLTIHFTRQLSSWQHKDKWSIRFTVLTDLFSSKTPPPHERGAGRGGGESTHHETRPHKPQGFLLITNVHPLHRLYPSRGPLGSVVLMLKSRTEHNVFFSCFFLYIVNRNLNFTKTASRSGSGGKNNLKSLLPWIKKFWLDFL